MSELTPEKYEAQEAAKAKLRSMRQENDTFLARREEALIEARKTGLSLRDLASAVGMSPQGVSNILPVELRGPVQ